MDKNPLYITVHMGSPLLILCCGRFSSIIMRVVLTKNTSISTPWAVLSNLEHDVDSGGTGDEAGYAGS